MNFPNSNRYNGNGNGSSYVIINGRRQPVQGSVQGRELAGMASCTPGRRLVKIANGQVSSINPNRSYSPEELRDRYGNPVKITSIPDRTKGADLSGLERMLVFMDFANIEAGARCYGRIDYNGLLQYLAQNRFLVEAYAYVPIDPRRPDARKDLVRHLQESGWMVMTKMGKIAGDSYKSNVDVEMTIDIMRSAQQIRPDSIVLCSGDGDFVPVVRELRRMGIRCEVAAFESTAGGDIASESSGFVSLDIWLQETDMPVSEGMPDMDADAQEDFLSDQELPQPDTFASMKEAQPDNSIPATRLELPRRSADATA